MAHLGDLCRPLAINDWLELFNRTNEFVHAHSSWANKVAVSNLNAIKEAEAFFAIVNGAPPDEGVMIELGFAIALAKPTFLFRDDFRRCTDSEYYPLNLMLFAGLSPESWQDYFYISLEDLSNPKKALINWLKN